MNQIVTPQAMARRLGHTYIRAWREKRGLSLRQLAGRLETTPGGDPLISFASLGRIEKGKQPYSQPILEALAFALNVTPSMLLEMDPNAEGQVIDMLRRLGPAKQSEALEYLRYLATK